MEALFWNKIILERKFFSEKYQKICSPIKNQKSSFDKIFVT